jgi:hypothetical protein
MDPEQPAPDQGLEVVALHRAELRGSMDALERALAASAPGRAGAWAEHVRMALLELSADFRVHIEITEGPDGLHHAVMTTAPRLTNAVQRLGREHVLLQGLIDELLVLVSGPTPEDDVRTARERGTALLAQLARHRQRGADLVFEAYQTDIGGES